MLRLALALMLLGSAVDDLVATRFRTLQVSVPAVWQHTNDHGTEVFTAPAKDAQIKLDLGTTRSQLAPEDCRDKIVTALGSQGWQKISIGAQPAARMVVQDKSPDQRTVVDTITYVGCDGHTSWSLIFSIDDHRRDRYLPLVEKVAQSVTYVKGG